MGGTVVKRKKWSKIYRIGERFFATKEVDMSRQAKLETTVGDLVVALTDETQRQFHDERITYEVVAFMLAGLLKKPVMTALRRL
jgi:AmiR/NasT family two-component response regulator